MEGVRSIAMIMTCMSVCLFVYLENDSPDVTKFSVVVTCGRGLVLLWPQWNTLCTSGFVDDVTVAHSGPYGSWL